MILIITDKAFTSWHETYVSNEVYFLQNEGYEILSVNRVSRLKWHGGGENISEIYYQERD